ncbi:MAG: FtsQ-type POTRA domain-containing protein [Bacteroidetes bacterium]|nr:FtsQ-type POTRA domain-containing protein [Bacteroidota bacterium]
MKQILKYLPFALLLAIAIAAIVYAQKQQKEAVCEQISILIDSDSVGNQLLVDEDVLQMLAKHNDTVGKKIQDFDLLQIERRILENPFVLSAQSYFDMHNTLHIRITQRVPFVRIIGKSGDYYIDTAGRLLPLSPHFAPRVLVASGEIAEAYTKSYNLFAKAENDTLPAKHTILHDIVLLNRAIAGDPLLQAAIEQIYVLENNEMYLISKIGPPQIIFGTIDNYQQKLQNLKAFYQSQKSQENWDLYKAINIKYSNQVVAIKK